MSGERNSRGRLAPLALAALGVVFGDIGTSPLYAMSACFTGPNIQVTPEHVFGVLSLIFWTLVLVILLKYVVVVLNADNKGEGGVLALTALVINTERASPRRKMYAMLGILGAALFFSDGAITPAISVLSAVEGLHVAAPTADIPVLPITALVLVGLFLIQRHGTGSVGRVFGPVMLGWFLILAVMGVSWIVREPRVLLALDPTRALVLITQHKIGALGVLAGVFLTVTGGEALYADMGHFGKAPIRLGWMAIVMPALVLNYFGQGALLIERPEAIRNPFYLMAPEWSLWPLVVIATAATVIASQAVISGVFSVTTQAVSLGLFPRLRVEHSSAENAGQIYVPTMNWILMMAALALVVGFGSSAALAGAYGLAVSGAMTIVTPLTLSLIKSRTGRESRVLRAGLSLLFVVDIAFLLANLTKLEEGGWLPLLSGLDHFLADANLAKRQSCGPGAAAARTEAGARLPRGLEARSAGARARYRHLHGREGIRHPAGAAQQHQVQPRHAREGGAAHGGYPRAAAHRRREAALCNSGGRGHRETGGAGRLHGEAQHPGNSSRRGCPRCSL